MILVRGISLGLDEDQQKCYEMGLRRLKIPRSQVLEQRIVKRSVDARKKDHIRFTYTVGYVLKDESQVELSIDVGSTQEKPLVFEQGTQALSQRPVVVGFGPAGMFCALYLARQGYRPLVLERGEAVEQRMESIRLFHEKGILSPSSNVQFGEGGAGTFSDGKLTTRINDPRCTAVLRDFAAMGAPQEILWAAKPHIGTDVLRQVVVAFRQEILRLGGEIRFGCQMERLLFENGRITGVAAQGEEIPAQQVVLALGHSARDTFRTLMAQGVPMETKPFSVGARIEHLQSEVDKALYGQFAGHPLLPPGEYQLAWRDKAGRAVYTFCMCPGGYVVPAASAPETVVTNGMSYHSRDGRNANAALVVSVDQRDFGNNPLDAIAFQEKIERGAYQMTGGYQAPCQTVGRFLEGRPGADFGRVEPTYALGVRPGDLAALFPPVVPEYMRRGIQWMGRRQRGFDAADSLLTGPETRTSSPVRLLRDQQTLVSPLAEGLYPCGEGGGYAGGIMSAAVDGIRVAQQIVASGRPVYD